MPCAYDLLWELMRAMGRDLHEVAGAEGLTPMQLMLLDRIDDDVAVPMSNLAAQLQCDRSNLTGIVDGLEAVGLVERTTPPDDRRVRALVTTERGRQMRARVGRRLREDNPLLARLEPEALRELEHLVQQVLTPPESAPVSLRPTR